MIIRLLDRDSDVRPVPDGGSDTAVITTEIPGPGGQVPGAASQGAEPAQLELSCRTGANGYQIVSVTGELDIATAEQAYSYISEIIDGRPRRAAGPGRYFRRLSRLYHFPRLALARRRCRDPVDE